MTTSGTTTFNMDVAQIIEEAAARIGGEALSGDEANSARMSLNLLFTHLVNINAPLSTQELRTLNLSVGVSEYDLGSEVINVKNAVIRDPDTSYDIELNRDDIYAYNTVYNKTQEGRPTTIYIDKTYDNTKLITWPVNEVSGRIIKYWATVKIEDVTASTQTIELPVGYLPAIISGLAYYMSLKRRNIPADYRAELKQLFTDELNAALGEDRFGTSFYGRPKINAGKN